MAKRTQSKRECQYCGTAVSKNTATRLATCPERQLVLERADKSGKKAETLYYLRVQGAYVKEFWLDLEMNASG